MGDARRDFRRDTTEVLMGGSSRRLEPNPGVERARIDAATGRLQHAFRRQTGAPAAIAR